MIVSAITGMVGKTPGAGGGKIVNPGIAYWLVLESADVEPRAIVRNIQGALQGQAEVKLLQEPPIISTVDIMQNTLCTVMKDHSNTYIKRRMAESQVEVNDPAMLGGGSSVRLVRLRNELDEFAKQAKESLTNGGIIVDVLEY